MKIKMFILISCLLMALLLGQTTNTFAAPLQTSVPSNIVFRPVVSGLDQPLFATHAGDSSGRLFIVQRGGKILIWNGTTLNATPFLNVSSIIKTSGGEQGLLGLAFDPNYASNGYFYISYTNQSGIGNDVLARYKVSSGNANVADAGSAQILLTVTDTEENHNGGMLAFGPDGYLYFGLGDGGGAGDQHGAIGNGQNKATLLGKILRLDVSTVPYTIPTTNPFYSSTTAKKEIWAYGVRNPWRFSFDKTTGDLYIGDVGQGVQEEIDFQATSATGGANYGWRVREGNLCFNASSCVSPAGYVPPVAVYNHGADGSIGCSVTGGYVYRGTAFPELTGVYLYGDFCTGNLWGLYKNSSNQWTTKLIKATGYNISSFAEDENGELYIVDYGGQLIHIAKSPIITDKFYSRPTLDGHITESNETSGQGQFVDANNMALMVGDTGTNRQIRAILSFNTDRLPDTANITSVKLRIKKSSITGGDPFTSLGQLVADIGNPTFSNNIALQAGDFQATAGVNITAVFSSPPVADWYSAGIISPGFPYISLVGNTQFRLRFSMDDNNNLYIDRVNFVSGDAAADQPELTVNYFMP